MSDTQGSPLTLVHRLWQESSAIFAKHMAGRRMTETRLAILMALQDGANSQKEVIDRTGIDRSTMSTVLRCLAHGDYITRERRKDDSRAYALRLTPFGKATLKKIEPLARAADEEIAALLPAKAWKDVAASFNGHKI